VDHPKRKKVSRISSERRGKNVENIEVMQLTNHVRLGKDIEAFLSLKLVRLRHMNNVDQLLGKKGSNLMN
jgi:hypothetical protein